LDPSVCLIADPDPDPDPLQSRLSEIYTIFAFSFLKFVTFLSLKEKKNTFFGNKSEDLQSLVEKLQLLECVKTKIFFLKGTNLLEALV
jgi:hypothetical protein